MNLTTRLLPADEWPRLVGTEAETVWPALDPQTTRVLVVEEGAEIVGCWILAPVWHAECLWVAPMHRGKASVGRRLWALLQRTVREVGARGVVTAAVSDEIRRLLAHVGAVRVPGEAYVMTFQEKPSCQP